MGMFTSVGDALALQYGGSETNKRVAAPSSGGKEAAGGRGGGGGGGRGGVEVGVDGWNAELGRGVLLGVSSTP